MKGFLGFVFVAGLIAYFAFEGFVLAPLLVFFAVGTLGFYGLLVVATLALCYFLDAEDENFVTATVTFVLFFLILNFLGDNQIFKAVQQQPTIVLGYVAAYIVIGAIWTVVKWWRYVASHRRRYDELRSKFLTENKIDEAALRRSDALKKKWRDSLQYARPKIEVPPRARDHKKRIIAWGCYFPWSMMATLLNDPVRRIFLEIYNRFQKVYQRIADQQFSGVDQDLMKKDSD